MTEEGRLEEGPLWKRENSAKFHPFLGSRVSTDLAFALVDIDATHISRQLDKFHCSGRYPNAISSGGWRSGPVIALPTISSDDIDRLKNLTTVNVCGAVKMERSGVDGI
jgi:hypothetical protein